MFRDNTKSKSLFSVLEIVSAKKHLFYLSFSFDEVTFVKKKEKNIGQYGYFMNCSRGNFVQNCRTAGYREKTYEIIRPMLLRSKNVGYLLLFL